jgi:hypothetical protein
MIKNVNNTNFSGYFITVNFCLKKPMSDLIFIIKLNNSIKRKIQGSLSLSYKINIKEIILKRNVYEQDVKMLTVFNSLDIRLNDGLHREHGLVQ